MRIGLISDTHDNTHPLVPRVFHGVDRILHAGDICRADVLRDLHGIAPVTAVRGTNEGGYLRDRLPEIHEEVIGGWRILLRHDIEKPELFRKRLESADEMGVSFPDIVVSGRSHKHWWEYVDGIWFVNPGSAGLPRYQSRPTCAILSLNATASPQVEFVHLDAQ